MIDFNDPFNYSVPDPFVNAPDDWIQEHRKDKVRYDRIIESNRVSEVERTSEGVAHLARNIANLKDLVRELESRNRGLSLYRDYDDKFCDEERKCRDLLLDLEGQQSQIEYELKYYALELSRQTLELGRQTLEMSDKTVGLGDRTVKLTSKMNALTSDIKTLTKWVVFIAVVQLIIGIVTIIMQGSSS